MKRKVITTITSIAILLSLFSVNASVVQAESLSGGQLLKQYIMENSIVEETTVSTELTSEDEASLNASYIQSYIESNETAKQSYGGCYIDDNGKLHVLFTENVANSVVNSVNTMTDNNIVYETCEYTLDELTALKEYISGFMSAQITDAELAEIADDIAAVGIYEQLNKVFVEILNCTNEKIAIFQEKISSSDLIIFENAQRKEIRAELKPGGFILVDISNTESAAMSIGFRCRVLNSSGSYINGFVTAGHHGGDINSEVYYSGIYLGYVTKTQFSGSVDAAFVYVTNAGLVPSNITQQGSRTLSTNTYISSYATGATVYQEGFMSGSISGKIISTSKTEKVYYETNKYVTITDLVETDYATKGGDSGGVTYMYVDNQYRVAGVLSCGDDEYSCFVKVKNIKNAFGVIIY